MWPTYRVGQMIEARPVMRGRYRPHRCDVVIYIERPFWNSSEQRVLKRVIAVGGDTVRCCTTPKLVVNGSPVTRSDGAIPAASVVGLVARDG